MYVSLVDVMVLCTYQQAQKSPVIVVRGFDDKQSLSMTPTDRNCKAGHSYYHDACDWL